MTYLASARSINSVTNISTTPLGSGGVFTGTSEDTLDFISVSIQTYSDQSGSLSVQFSNDGTNWDESESYVTIGGSPLNVQSICQGRYFRIVYTNGAVAQTTFRLNAVFKIAALGGEVLVANRTPTSGTDSQVSQAIVTGKSSVALGAYTQAKVTPSGELRVSNAPGSQDIFGSLTTGIRNNQIEIPFIGATIPSSVTQTTSGGATISQANGQLSIISSVGTTAAASLISNATIVYHSASEIYAYFTASFTTPTNAATNQRIGLYDANNGFRIGWEGTIGGLAGSATFGITIRTGGVDTFIGRTAWNGDLLTGVIYSGFTRNNVAEAINLTYHNVYRIRYGWLGSAPIVFEVMSPDGVWVMFHTILQPNSSVNPSVQNPNLPMTAEVNKVAADATSLTIGTSCWAAGVTAVGKFPVFFSSTAALGSNATVTSQTFDTFNGQCWISYSAFSVTNLSVIFDESSDGINFTPIDNYTVGAGQSNYSFHKSTGRYCRVRFVNSATANPGGIANLSLYASQSAYANETDVSLIDSYGNSLAKNGYLNVQYATGTQDTFGNLITASRLNQIEVSFSGTSIPSNVTPATSGGATITNTSGAALLTSGAAVTASATLTSIATVIYHAGTEIYALFTASFTTPTSAASYQHIGIFDANNGFRLGWEGTIGSLAGSATFGLVIRTGVADTFIPRTSWNGDLLTGLGGSKFTRSGVPEAINLTFHNVFRIRYGWLGSSPIVFEILSPDGAWVTFHTIMQPNTSANPSIQIPNVPIKAEVVKSSADATSLTLSTSCWGAGTTSEQPYNTYDLTNAALAIGATYTTQTFDTTFLGTFLTYNLFSTTPGSIYLDVSSDAVTWTPSFTDQNVPGQMYSYSSAVQTRYARFRFVNGYVANAGGQANLYQTVSQTIVGTEAQINIGNQYGNSVIVTPYGSLQVSTEPGGLFFDDFDSFDTVYKWNAPVIGGTATSAATTGALVITLGTASGNSVVLTSQPAFLYTGFSYINAGFRVQLEAAAITNSRRLWGRGTYSGTSPTNFLGFELTAAGVLQAVIYFAGSLVASSPIAKPTDGLYHSYFVQSRVDGIFYYFDNADSPIFTYYSQTLMPGSEGILFIGVNTALASGTPTFNVMAAAVTDSSKLASQISDGVNPFIRASVSAKGVQGSYALTVQNLRDSGRNTRIFMLDTFTAAPLAEALQSVVQWYGNVAVGATTQPAVVPTGKTLRLTGWRIEYQSLATVGAAVCRIRCNVAGLVVIGSPLVFSFGAGSGAGATTVAMTGGMTVETGSFPDGLEIPAGAGVGFTLAGYGPTGTLTLEGTTRFSVYGFEY